MYKYRCGYTNVRNINARDPDLLVRRGNGVNPMPRFDERTPDLTLNLHHHSHLGFRWLSLIHIDLHWSPTNCTTSRCCSLFSSRAPKHQIVLADGADGWVPAPTALIVSNTAAVVHSTVQCRSTRTITTGMWLRAALISSR